MKILYVCNFNLDNYSGRNRATKQKLKALKKQIDELYIISSKLKKFKFLELFFIELKSIYMILKYKPNIFISRGFVGYFSQKLCKIMNIKTVREIHADILGELNQLNKHWLVKFFLIPLSIYTQKIDALSDIRIFNHPYLLDWFKSNFFDSSNDIYVYNGYDIKSRSLLTKEEVIKKYNLDKEIKYLVFVGEASYWHGIDYLVCLQESLNKLTKNIKIICAGGKVSKEDDPEKLLINITPLNDVGCAEIIQASEACLLPVRQSRVSPGSPLKLYDYILHKKYVITQKELKGYEDEVLRYNFGESVDFNDSENLSFKIIEILKNLRDKDEQIIIENFSWDERMKEWLLGIWKYENKIRD